MKLSTFVRCALVVLILTVFSTQFSTPAVAQTNRGGISGTVFDSHGAVVSGATVVITSLGTNESVRLTTSSSGTFSASNLNPVEYRIEVSMAGFAKAVVDRVKVDTAAVATQNIHLQPGTVETTVQVQESAPLVNTESGATGYNIAQRQLADVPLVNRSVLDLAMTAPNVSGTAGSEDAAVTSGNPVPGFNININGGRAGSTVMLADGVNNTGVGIARAVVSFTPETVQEFSVQTSAYDAQYGSTGGGVISVTTKSGTNQIHGAALWYTRNPITNAKLWTAGTTRPANNLRYNQFSGSVGGPVWIPKVYNGHNKTFFFFAGEPRYQQNFLVVDTLLPTLANRKGDFSNMTRTSSGWLPTDVATQFGLTSVGPNTIYQQFNLVNGQWKRITGNPVAFAGNLIPDAMIDPAAKLALQFMPEPGAYHLDANGRVKNYVVNRFVKQNEVRYNMRIDHNLNDKNKMNFRYTYVPAVGTRGFGSDVNGNSASYSWSRQMVFSDTHLFSSTLMNDLRLNYTRGTFSEDFSPEFSIKNGRNLATELGLPSLTNGGMPLFQFSSDSNGYDAFTNIGSSASTNNYNVEERYNIVDMVYWTRGNMTWKFGVDLSHSLLNVIPFFSASGGRWDFRTAQTSSQFQSTAVGNGGNPFASYLLGIPNVVAVRPILMPYYYRWNAAAAFIQNDWKVKPNLTLNLGIRYSLQLPRTEKNNLQGSFVPGLAQPFTLTTPITIPGTSTTLTSLMVPPFQYAGRGGASKYIFPIERWDFEPRIGVAWSPGLWASRGFVVRGGYGLSHVPITGNNRLPNPDFGGFINVSMLGTPGTGSCGTTLSSGAVDPCSAIRLSSNVPALNKSLTPAQALNIPANGLVYLPSLGIPGYAISKNSGIPYVQNWNVSLAAQVLHDTSLEAGYVGSRGSKLYTQLINANPRDFNTVQAMLNSFVPAPGASGTAVAPVGTETNLSDPLGRKDLLGNTITVPWGSLASTFQGFNNLNTYYNAVGNSVRHGVYVSGIRRMSSGLTLSVNYTFSKSLDNASDASPDTRTLISPTSSGGNISFGAPLASDYSLSTFDQRHVFNATYIYDLPFGQRRKFLTNAPGPVNAVLGGWTTSGVVRMFSTYPFMPTLSDANGLNATLTHTVRPDRVPGVPIINPDYDRNCVTSAICEPYINPAAFERPVKGVLGNASRVLGVRGPTQRFYDASIQKNFNLPHGWSADGKRYVQFRMDLLNAFNHPNFQMSSGSAGPDFMAAPNEGTVTINTTTGVRTFTPIATTDYDAWAKINNQPLSTTSAGAAQLTAINSMVNANRQSNGALPDNFWNTPVPRHFATADPNSYDIRTLSGYKLYRLRQAYSTSFGQLGEVGSRSNGQGTPRYIQFGVKVVF